MLSGALFVSVLPFVVLMVVVLMILILGLRQGGTPTCRACDASVARFGNPPTHCPACNVSLARRRAVVFHGRRRPIKLWLVCCSIGVPLILVFAVALSFALGVVNQRSIQQAFGPTAPLNGPLSFAQAQTLSTADLLAAMDTHASTWGWMELRDRIEENPSETNLLGALAVAHRAMEATDEAATIETSEFDWVATTALAKLGTDHEAVIAFATTHLLIEPTCPTVSAGNRFTFVDVSETSNALHLLFGYSSGYRPVVLVEKLVFDGKELPRHRDDGAPTWLPNSPYVRIASNLLPESVLTPGEHELSITLRSAILPPGVSESLEADLWPSPVIEEFSTLTCTYTIKGTE